MKFSAKMLHIVHTKKREAMASRQYCIFPIGGWNLAPPFIADPLANVPFTITYPDWDFKTDSIIMRSETMGFSWDDDVWNTGGLSHDMVNWLNQLWHRIKTLWRELDLLAPWIGNPFLLTDARTVVTVQNVKQVKVEFLTPPTGVDFWYGTTDFAKFGFVAPVTTDNFRGAQTWLNWLRQIVTFDNYYDGVDIMCQGAAILGLANFFVAGPPPSITFAGWEGLSGTYDDRGLIFT